MAREAGVSIATVSYIFNGTKSISDDTRARVLAAVEKLDYVPNLSARTLGGSDSLLIGVLVPQTEPGNALMFRNSFYGEILSAIEYEARVNGYHILISGTDPEESYMTLVRKRNLDGIIAIGVYPSEFYTEASQSRVPLVLVDSYCTGQRHHSVRIDDADASFLAARFLLDKGHREIAFFCGQLRDDGIMRKRLDGYKQALEEGGVPYREQLVYEGRIDYQSGADLANAFLKDKATATAAATAVLAAADILAIGAMSAFAAAGRRIPDDISVMGFDDLEIAQYVSPGLTTVHQQIAEKGRKAVEMLVQSIKEPALTKREVILPVNIVERGSVLNLRNSN